MSVQQRMHRPGRTSSDHGENHRLTAATGLSALGLDALASVAYGPEAIVLALAAAGAAGIGFTLPVTLAIVALLLVLVACYRQVITAYPDGGGAYSVSTRNLGRSAGLVAAASLVVDYVLNAAVATAAGIAALTSAFPGLLPWTVELCLLALGLITAVNLRGMVAGAKAFAGPALLFIALVSVIIVVGLVRGAPLNPLPTPTHTEVTTSVGILLILAAFANGCSALTGIEAIANATPSFRKPRAQRARRAELSLGLVLGTLLVTLSVLIERFHLAPVDGRTVLSLLAEGAVGQGAVYFLVQLSTVVLLVLSANTSYAGLPGLLARLAGDGALPHVLGLRGDRQVYRWGIVLLSVVTAALLVGSRGQVSLLVPLFAVGVFVGFTLSQVGMVVHWTREQGNQWRARRALNGLGALLTFVATAVLVVEKFSEGAWLIVVAIPVLVAVFTSVRRSYDRIGAALGVDETPVHPHRCLDTVVVVPVVAINRLTADTLTAALSMSSQVYAVHVVFADDPDEGRRLRDQWIAWRPNVPLVLLESAHRSLGPELVRYVRQVNAERVLVLVGEVAPEHWWQQVLFNRRGASVARALERGTTSTVCRFGFRLHLDDARNAEREATLRA